MINIFWGICLTMIVFKDFVNIFTKTCHFSANDDDIAVLITLVLLASTLSFSGSLKPVICLVLAKLKFVLLSYINLILKFSVAVDFITTRQLPDSKLPTSNF